MSEETKKEGAKKKPEPVFDAGQKFRIKHLTANGIQVVEMAFPSDEDWIARESRRRKIITFSTGDGEPDTKIEDPDERESELVKKLCPELAGIDPEEAGRLLDQLAYADVANPDDVIQGGCLVVSLDVPRARTQHTFRMPSAREMQNFKRHSFDQRSISKRSMASVRNFAFLGKLYREMLQSVTGYAGDVPIIHQYSALFVAMSALEEMLDSRRDP